MKKCKCENYKKLIIDINAVDRTQDWNFCVFCGLKMEEVKDE